MKTFNILFIIFFLFFIKETYSQEEKNEFVRTLKGHKNRVNSVHFSSDGKYIISGSWDETLKLWKIESGEEIRTFKGYDNNINAVAYSSDGEFIINADTSDNNFRLSRISNGKILNVFKEHKTKIVSLAFSPDGNYIISGSEDNNLIFWDRRESKKIKKYKGHDNLINDIDFNNDGKIFATASNDKTIRIWDITRKYARKTLEEHKDIVTHIEFSPDGRTLISSSADKNLILWNVSSGDTIRSFIGHTNKINSVAFSPDGNYIVSAGSDTTIRIWETESARLLGIFTGHQSIINCVQFSPDGKYIVSASDDNTLKLWDYYNLLEENLSKNFSIRTSSEIELVDLFSTKDEFETLSEYEERINKAELFTLEMYEKYRQIEDDSLELIVLREQKFLLNEDLAIKKQKEIDSIANVMLTDEKSEIKIDRAQKVELSRRENIKKSYEIIHLKIDILGYYNAEAEYFPVTILGNVEYVKIRRDEARILKQNLQDVEVIGAKQLLEDCETFDIFNIKLIHPRTGIAYEFGKQKKPLYLEDAEMSFILENENATHPEDKWETDEFNEEEYEEENNTDSIIETIQDTLEIIKQIEPEVFIKEDEKFKIEYKFVEPSFDNILNAKEEGNLQITITNKSKIELKKLKIKLNSKDAHKALKYDKSAIFKKLSAGEKDIRILKIKASKKIIDGTFNFNITFEEKNNNLPQGFKLIIETSKNEIPEKENIDIEKKEVEEEEEEEENENEEISKNDKRPILEMKIIEFIDDGRDNILNAKEEGKLILTIRNTSKKNLKKIKILVETENVSKNLKYKKKITVKKISANANHTEKIVFKASKKIETTEVKIKISIEESENYKGENVEFNISTKKNEE